jgi:hypothetical protein
MLRLAFFLLLCIATTAVHAQNPISRCIGADGRPVFTDQPCASLNATPTVGPETPANIPPGNIPGTASTVPVLCASSRGQLRQAVVDAFAARDANRLAGLVLWNGYGNAGAVANIRQLTALTRQPLLDVGGRSAEVADDGAEAAATDELLVRTGMSGAPQETRFAIVRQSGCLWLTPPQ